MRILVELAGSAAFYEHGELTGSAVEIVHEIARRTECGCTMETVPWKRGYAALRHDPDVALIPTTRTAARERLFHWIGPILRVQWVLLARSDADISINSLDDARDVRAIGTNIGDAREQFLKERGFRNIESTTSNVLNLRKLAGGRVDLVFATTAGMFEAIREIHADPKAFRVAYEVREVDLYVAVSAQTGDEQVRQWRQAFESMREDGTFQRIYRKWYPDRTPPLSPAETLP